MKESQVFFKRIFDVTFSIVGIILTWWLILIAYIIASIDTKSNGLFIHERIGKSGKKFNLFKIKTMKDDKSIKTTVTSSSDPRITPIGAFLRKTKIDELPQLFNILIGNMSFVGPRPDVPGYADELKGNQRKILKIRPGITGPATLEYKNEEEILEKKSNPEKYNREVIYPHKVSINLRYINNYSFIDDIKYILLTIVPSLDLKVKYGKR